MPKVPSESGGAHRSHDFRVQGDRDIMAKAVVVERAELGDGALRLEIAPGAVGHAFPTGDLNRQVEVRAAPVNAEGQTLGPNSREILGRTFGPIHSGPNTFVPAPRSDTRLFGRRTLVFPLPAGTRRARYQIVWQRLPPEMAARLGMKMSKHEMVVVEGVVSR